MLNQEDDVLGHDLLDLPNELLEIIIQDLDDETLFQMSQTCRKLHYLALPVWFKRNSVIIPAGGWFNVCRPRSEHLLPAVRMALFVRRLRNINYYLNPDVDRILGEFRELRRLAARMPAFDSLVLHFTVFESWLADYSSSQKIQLDRNAWKGQLTGMLDQFLNKGCKQLLLIDGASIWSASMCKSTISLGMRTTGSGFRMWKALRRLWFVNLRTEGELTHTRHSDDTTQAASGSSPEFKPKELFFHSRTSTSILLQTFQLRSPIFLDPLFFDWTVRVFRKSQAITTLSLLADMPRGALSDLLSNITLPALSSFEISCTLIFPSNPIGWRSLESFLTQHPSITTLHLYGVRFPHKFATLKKAILPYLINVTAHPNYVAWLLGPQDALPHIKTVTISSHYHSTNVSFDHNLFDHAIKSVASITRKVVLCIRFASQPRVEEWLHKHVSAGRKGSVIALLIGVTKLKISCSYHFQFSPSTLRVLTDFLALFPSLKCVHFVETVMDLEDLMLEQDFFKSTASTCLGIKTIQVDWSRRHKLSSLRE